MQFKNKFRTNKKLLSALGFTILAALIFISGGAKNRVRADDFSPTISALGQIQVEAENVRTARNNYFTAIGKENGGAYDQYVESANCQDNLDLRLTGLKNLRNDLQRLSGEIVLRERENQSLFPKGSIAVVVDSIKNAIEPFLLVSPSQSGGAIEPWDPWNSDSDETTNPWDPWHLNQNGEVISTTTEPWDPWSSESDDTTSPWNPWNLSPEGTTIINATQSGLIETELEKIEAAVKNDNTTAAASIRTNVTAIRSNLKSSNPNATVVLAELTKMEGQLTGLLTNSERTLVAASIKQIRSIVGTSAVTNTTTIINATQSGLIETELEKIEAAVKGDNTTAAASIRTNVTAIRSNLKSSSPSAAVILAELTKMDGQVPGLLTNSERTLVTASIKQIRNIVGTSAGADTTQGGLIETELDKIETAIKGDNTTAAASIRTNVTAIRSNLKSSNPNATVVLAELTKMEGQLTGLLTNSERTLVAASIKQIRSIVGTSAGADTTQGGLIEKELEKIEAAVKNDNTTAAASIRTSVTAIRSNLKSSNPNATVVLAELTKMEGQLTGLLTNSERTLVAASIKQIRSIVGTSAGTDTTQGGLIETELDKIEAAVKGDNTTAAASIRTNVTAIRSNLKSSNPNATVVLAELTKMEGQLTGLLTNSERTLVAASIKQIRSIVGTSEAPIITIQENGLIETELQKIETAVKGDNTTAAASIRTSVTAIRSHLKSSNPSAAVILAELTKMDGQVSGLLTNSERTLVTASITKIRSIVVMNTTIITNVTQGGLIETELEKIEAAVKGDNTTAAASIRTSVTAIRSHLKSSNPSAAVVLAELTKMDGQVSGLLTNSERTLVTASITQIRSIVGTSVPPIITQSGLVETELEKIETAVKGDNTTAAASIRTSVTAIRSNLKSSNPSATVVLAELTKMEGQLTGLLTNSERTLVAASITKIRNIVGTSVPPITTQNGLVETELEKIETAVKGDNTTAAASIRTSVTAIRSNLKSSNSSATVILAELTKMEGQVPGLLTNSERTLVTTSIMKIRSIVGTSEAPVITIQENGLIEKELNNIETAVKGDNTTAAASIRTNVTAIRSNLKSSSPSAAVILAELTKMEGQLTGLLTNSERTIVAASITKIRSIVGTSIPPVPTQGGLIETELDKIETAVKGDNTTAAASIRTSVTAIRSHLKSSNPSAAVILAELTKMEGQVSGLLTNSERTLVTASITQIRNIVVMNTTIITNVTQGGLIETELEKIEVAVKGDNTTAAASIRTSVTAIRSNLKSSNPNATVVLAELTKMEGQLTGLLTNSERTLVAASITKIRNIVGTSEAPVVVTTQSGMIETELDNIETAVKGDNTTAAASIRTSVTAIRNNLKSSSPSAAVILAKLTEMDGQVSGLLTNSERTLVTASITKIRSILVTNTTTITTQNGLIETELEKIEAAVKGDNTTAAASIRTNITAIRSNLKSSSPSATTILAELTKMEGQVSGLLTNSERTLVTASIKQIRSIVGTSEAPIITQSGLIETELNNIETAVKGDNTTAAASIRTNITAIRSNLKSSSSSATVILAELTEIEGQVSGLLTNSERTLVTASITKIRSILVTNTTVITTQNGLIETELEKIEAAVKGDNTTAAASIRTNVTAIRSNLKSSNPNATAILAELTKMDGQVPGLLTNSERTLVTASIKQIRSIVGTSEAPIVVTTQGGMIEIELDKIEAAVKGDNTTAAASIRTNVTAARNNLKSSSPSATTILAELTKMENQVSGLLTNSERNAVMTSITQIRNIVGTSEAPVITIQENGLIEKELNNIETAVKGDNTTAAASIRTSVTAARNNLKSSNSSATTILAELTKMDNQVDGLLTNSERTLVTTSIAKIRSIVGTSEAPVVVTTQGGMIEIELDKIETAVKGDNTTAAASIRTSVTAARNNLKSSNPSATTILAELTKMDVQVDGLLTNSERTLVTASIKQIRSIVGTSEAPVVVTTQGGMIEIELDKIEAAVKNDNTTAAASIRTSVTAARNNLKSSSPSATTILAELTKMENQVSGLLTNSERNAVMTSITQIRNIVGTSEAPVVTIQENGLIEKELNNIETAVKGDNTTAAASIRTNVTAIRNNLKSSNSSATTILAELTKMDNQVDGLLTNSERTLVTTSITKIRSIVGTSEAPIITIQENGLIEKELNNIETAVKGDNTTAAASIRTSVTAIRSNLKSSNPNATVILAELTEMEDQIDGLLTNSERTLVAASITKIRSILVTNTTVVTTQGGLIETELQKIVDAMVNDNTAAATSIRTSVTAILGNLKSSSPSATVVLAELTKMESQIDGLLTNSERNAVMTSITKIRSIVGTSAVTNPPPVVTQAGVIETELQKIETAVQGDSSSSARSILVSVGTIRSNLANSPSASVILGELDKIADHASSLSSSAQTAVMISVANIRKIVGLSEDTEVIRDLAQAISDVTEGNVSLEEVESNLQAIEAKISGLPENQKDVVRDGVDAIRKLISNQGAAVNRKAQITALEAQIQKIADNLFSEEEIGTIEAEEASQRADFQTKTASLQSCMGAYLDANVIRTELTKMDSQVSGLSTNSAYTSITTNIAIIRAAISTPVETDTISATQGDLIEKELEKIVAAVKDDTVHAADNIRADAKSDANISTLSKTAILGKLDMLEAAVPDLSTDAERTKVTASIATIRNIVNTQASPIIANSDTIEKALQDIVNTGNGTTAAASIQTNVTAIRSNLTSSNPSATVVQDKLDRIGGQIFGLSNDSAYTLVTESIEEIRRVMGNSATITTQGGLIEAELQKIVDAVQSYNTAAAISIRASVTTIRNDLTSGSPTTSKCQSEIIAWIAQKEEYQKFIIDLQNLTSSRTIAAEAEIEPLQKKLDQLKAEEAAATTVTNLNPLTSSLEAKYLKAWSLFGGDEPAVESPREWLGINKQADSSPQLSVLKNKFEAKYLKAEADGVGTWDMIKGGATEAGGFIGSVVSAPLEVVGGFISGATGALSAGIGAVAGALGISTDAAGSATSSGTVFDGIGSAKGLTAFASNYKGNTYGDAIGSITGWTNFTLPFVGVIAIAALIYAGFLYLTAAGNEDQAKKAKNIIIWVVIGIIIIFSAYAIVNTLLSGSSGSSSNGTNVNVSGGGVDVNYSN